jgi:SagB-type dehydrogenase family enzyme
MEALKARSSARDFKPDALSQQTLSNLLWAAFGINRNDGKRTAPSPHNKQEIDIYVALASGTYRYGAQKHVLEQVAEEDLRSFTGTQDFVKTAPLNLVYVADLAKLDGPDDLKLQWSGADTGFIGQNVYLFCASEGLATVIRGSFDRAALGKALKLRPEQRIVLSQTVGYPK